MERPKLNTEDSVICCSFDSDSEKVLFEHKSGEPRTVASISKVLLGAEVARMLHAGEIGNTVIQVTPNFLAGYGSDVLFDLYSEQNKLSLDVLTLIRLAIKRSCNTATIILDNKFLRDRAKLEKNARSFWGMEHVHLKYRTNHPDPENQMSIKDVYILFRKIYTDKSEWLDIIRSSLKGSRSIYRLFDQQEVKILGSKSGTLQEHGYYWIGDCGVVEINGNMYFLGAIFKDKNISQGVTRMRELGKNLLAMIREDENKS